MTKRISTVSARRATVAQAIILTSCVLPLYASVAGCGGNATEVPEYSLTHEEMQQVAREDAEIDAAESE